jgi:large subunit ribosomal protein L10
MSKQLKQMITETLRDRYAGIDEACAVDITPLDVAATQEVRRALGEKNMAISVIKNSLARRAFADGPLAPLGATLSGPCALITGGDSVIEVAKEIASLAKTHPKIVLKEGLLSGEMETISVDDLAKMKSKVELLGDVAMLISSPGRAIAGCLNSAGGKIAGCLKAIVEKGEG